MIKKLKVLSGYALNLPRLKDEVEFKPGLNILFGPNGCGKSTTIKIAGAYCSTTAGWSGFHSPTELFGWRTLRDDREKKLPRCFVNLSPGKCEATLEWDGTPTLLADSAVTDATTWHALHYENSDSPDKLSGLEDQLDTMYNKPSAGMIRMKKLFLYYKALENPPDLTVIPKELQGHNDTWQESYQALVDYVKTLNPTKQVTLLMDEPDRSLSIENQMLFWTRFVDKVMQAGHQLVIATHSVFSLIHDKANWIEFEPDGLAKSREALNLLKGSNSF